MEALAWHEWEVGAGVAHAAYVGQGRGEVRMIRRLARCGDDDRRKRGLRSGGESRSGDQGQFEILKEFRTPYDANMLGLIQTDSVYTPSRAHMRVWGSSTVVCYAVTSEGVGSPPLAFPENTMAGRSGGRAKVLDGYPVRWRAFNQAADRLASSNRSRILGVGRNGSGSCAVCGDIFGT